MSDAEKFEAARQLVNQVADELAPALQAAGVTMVLVLGDEDHWSFSLRGSQSVAVRALEAATEGARDSDTFVPLQTARAR